MSITPAPASYYILNQDMSVDWIGRPIRINNVNMPTFNILLNGDVTTAGSFHVQVANAISANQNMDFLPLVWVDVDTVVVAAGLFPNGAAGFFWPDAVAAPAANIAQYKTGAEAIRLTWVPTGGTGSVKVSYHAKSFG